MKSPYTLSARTMPLPSRMTKFPPSTAALQLVTTQPLRVLPSKRGTNPSSAAGLSAAVARGGLPKRPRPRTQSVRTRVASRSALNCMQPSLQNAVRPRAGSIAVLARGLQRERRERRGKAGELEIGGWRMKIANCRKARGKSLQFAISNFQSPISNSQLLPREQPVQLLLRERNVRRRPLILEDLLRDEARDRREDAEVVGAFDGMEPHHRRLARGLPQLLQLLEVARPLGPLEDEGGALQLVH